MLQNTFMHIQSIGAVTEQRLWESGLSHWDAFSDDISIPLSGKRKYFLQKGIDESRRRRQIHSGPISLRLIESGAARKFGLPVNGIEHKLLFDSTGSKSLDNIALRENKENYRGQAGKHADCTKPGPLNHLIADKFKDPDGKRHCRFGLGKCQGVKKFVPGKKKGDNGSGSYGGDRKRQYNVEKRLVTGRAVNPCRV